MNKKFLYNVINYILFIYPLFTVLSSIVVGIIPFWFDPARDLLLALDNLKKPTLIGQPSGIPDVFYGPYWIWALSLGQLISWDPRIIVLLVLTIPYFTVFPYILSKFVNKLELERRFIFLLFFLFMISYGSRYTTFIWNVHVAPLLFFSIAYLLTTFRYKDDRLLLKFFIGGGLSGLIINFSMSFGIAVLLGILLFLLLDFSDYLLPLSDKKANALMKAKRIALVLLGFSTGFISVFSPFLLFEYRHGFMQIQSFIKTFTDSLLYNSAVVGQVGLSKLFIVQMFFGKFGELLHLTSHVGYGLLLLILISILMYARRRKIQPTEYEWRLLLFLLSTIIAILFTYLLTKNPVWDYYFIGVELIMLLFILLILKWIPIFRPFFYLWIVVLLVLNVIDYSKFFSTSPYEITGLASKRKVVDEIFQDAHNKPFSYFAYSSSIYTYDFDYLVKWRGKEVFHTMPSPLQEALYIYLIIPHGTSQPIKEDFINYKTQDKEYTTEKEWSTKDGTLIIKRVNN